MYVPAYHGFYDGLSSLDFDAAKSWINDETVYFFRLDRLVVSEYDCAVETLDAQNIANPVFIKIDVQGTEDQVVEGGVETLKRYQPILLVEDFHEKPDLQKLTASLGYDPYNFDGSAFLPGPSDTSTFLITRIRIDAMGSRRKSVKRQDIATG